MLVEENWQLSGKCRKLSPLEADALFFPSSGGKPQKAATFCSDCPIKALCLVKAIEQKLNGYFAGTTDDDRRVMSRLHNIQVVAPLEADMPPEPDRAKRRIYRKVFSPDDPRNWLDEGTLEPTAEELAVALVDELESDVSVVAMGSRVRRATLIAV